MKNNSIKCKIITALIIASIPVSTSGVAFAANTGVAETATYTQSGDTVTKSNENITAEDVNESIAKVRVQ